MTLPASGLPQPQDDSARPTVSVVVPNYRHETFLPERIDSILEQTFQDFELILLDDASPDGSRDVLDGYAAKDPGRIKTVYNEQNSGSAFKQWNKALDLARGAYVWVAESDDAAEPDLLETLLEPLLADERVGLACCDPVTIDTDGTESWLSREFIDQELRLLGEAGFTRPFERPSSMHVYEPGELLQLGLAAVNLVPNASGVVFSKRAAESVGQADPSFSLCADWLMWGRLAAEYRVAWSPRPLNRYRKHDQTARAGTRAVDELVERHRVVRELVQVAGLKRVDRRAAARTLLKRAATWYRDGRFGRLGFVRAIQPIAGIDLPRAVHSLRVLARRRDPGASENE